MDNMSTLGNKYLSKVNHFCTSTLWSNEIYKSFQHIDSTVLNIPYCFKLHETLKGKGRKVTIQ